MIKRHVMGRQPGHLHMLAVLDGSLVNTGLDVAPFGNPLC
jgi:hypothetical protein